MPTKLKQSLTITGDTGVTASNSGVAWDGSSPVVQEISLGQSIGTTDDVQFNSITSSLWKLGDDISISDNGQILGSVTNTGTLSVSSTLTIGGNATTTGKITAEEIIAELTSSNTIFKSGSTQFGDSIDDDHLFTGSLFIIASIAVAFILNFAQPFLVPLVIALLIRILIDPIIDYQIDFLLSHSTRHLKIRHR